MVIRIDQRKFSFKTFKLQTVVMAHHHVNPIIATPSSSSWESESVTVSARVNSRAKKTLSGAKPCAFLGDVAPGVAEVGSLFPQLQAYISGKVVDKKCTGLFSESSMRTSKSLKKGMLGALLEDQCGKMWMRLHQKINSHVRSTFGRKSSPDSASSISTS